MKPAKSTGLISAVLLLQQAAGAADWSYCIAPADTENRIYVSFPFPAIGLQPEADFDDSLARRRLPHDSVQCRRADDEVDAVIMRQHTIEVNRLWGRQVVDLRAPSTMMMTRR